MTVLLQMQATLLQLVILLISGHIAALNSLVTTLPGFSGDLPFKLETGYVGVGDEDDVQLFYSFVESDNSPQYDPLVLWVSGGPGCSAFNALLFENVGPLIFDYHNSTSDDPKLLSNPYSWTQVANMIFLDAPVGAGFSYAKTWKNESSMNDTLSAADTYEFLQKWLVDHPDFLKNPLYVAGDSYAGILVPMIVQHISDGIEDGLEPQMNLKGYILGNPVTVHKRETYDQVQFSHQHGLISDDLYQSLQTNCEGDYSDIDQKNASCVDDYALFTECVKDIYFPQILEPACTLESLTSMGSKGEPNDLSKKDSADLLLTFRELPRRWCRDLHYVYGATWANIKSVQEALHVQEGSITEWVRCNGTLKASYDTNVASSLVYHENLIKKGYKVLIYSGDHDLIMPYEGTIAWIETLNLTVSSRWRPWFVNGQVAGYTVLYKQEQYQLTYATVKGGGHTAPEFRPEECFSMISRWFAYYPL